MLTEIGAVDVDVPRDRNATFEPKIVPKGARRLEGFNSNIVALYARGLSTRDIRSELARMYGVDVSPALVSMMTIIENPQGRSSKIPTLGCVI